MSAVDAARAELDASAAGLESVTARRAVHTATQALGEFESSIALLTWERARVERVALERAERDRQAQAERAERERQAQAAERTRAQRRIDRITRDQNLVKGKAQ